MFTKKTRKPTASKLFSAFTLAEILITLGIIGVIAAITIPSLMQGQQERATVSTLKKLFSTLSNAYSLAVKEDGSPENWNLTDSGSDVGAINMINTLAPYLKVDKNCGTDWGCFPDVYYMNLDGKTQYKNINRHTSWAKLRLADGTLVATSIETKDCATAWGNHPGLQSICGYTFVDTNGFQKPNRLGVDGFLFFVTKYGMVASGIKPASVWSFSGTCSDSTSEIGLGCAAWVLYNDNLDYLHCNTLTWDGPTSCK